MRSWLARRSFQDWLILIVAIALVSLAVRPMIDETHGARITLAGAPATALRADPGTPRRWIVRFMFRNQGDRVATGVRLRILVATMREPTKLTPADNLILANDFDPGTEIVRPLLFRGPPVPAAAAPPAPTANGAANAAAPAPEPASAEPPQPANYVVVVQADYRTGTGLFASQARRRWYFTYTGGNGATVQAGQNLRDQIEANVNEALVN